MTQELLLKIEYNPTATGTITAWLLPENDPVAWLAEWQRWEIPLHELQVIPLGSQGLLTILTAGQVVKVTTRAIPYRQHGAFYLPAQSRLNGELPANETAALLPAAATWAIFLPHGEIIAVPESARRSVRDLLQAPALENRDWSRAEPGQQENERLLAILPLVLPTLREVLQAGQDDIGSQPLGDVPPRSHEPTDSVFEGGKRMVQNTLATIASWMASQLGSTAQSPQSSRGSQPTSPGPVTSLLAKLATSLQQWAEKTTQRVAANLDELRHREILRLMEMLHKNPDEGLKYAIPFGGEAARGMGTPGAHLTARNVEFALGSGSGPADYWQLSEQHRLALFTKYRELANRELAIGRFRRAAYIFSQLLNDHVAATQALISGQFWREAAVMYTEKLNQPRAAADCLLQGGLLQEALEKYQALGLHEIVGDIYARLEQLEEARNAWRVAALQQLQNHDYLEAARIFDEKLQAREETLQTLSQGWQSGRGTSPLCLRRSLEILARESQHEAARELLQQLAEPISRDHALWSAEILAAVIQNYPERQFCDQATDLVRVLASQHLSDAPTEAKRRWLAPVIAVAGSDRLIRRDAERFLTGVPRPKPVVRQAAPKTLRWVNHRQLLPAKVLVKAVLPTEDCFYVAAVHERRLKLWRATLEGRLQESVTIDRVYVAENIEVQLSAPYHHPRSIAVVTNHRLAAARWSFPAERADFAPIAAELVTSPDSPQLVACTFGLGNRFHFYRNSFGECWANVVNSWQGAKLTGTLRLGSWPTELEEKLLPVVGQGSFLAVGLGRTLHLAVHPQRQSQIELAEPIEEIAVSRPFTGLRLAVSVESGAYYLGSASGLKIASPVRFAHDLHRPKLSFSSTGHLLAIAENCGEVYSIQGEKFQLVSNLQSLPNPPVGVITAPTGNRFAVVLAHGEILFSEW